MLCNLGKVVVSAGEVVLELPRAQFFRCLVEVPEDDCWSAGDQFREMPAGNRIHDILARVFRGATCCQVSLHANPHRVRFFGIGWHHGLYDGECLGFVGETDTGCEC